MKKKLLSLLLIVMLCCSAVYIFAGCSGNNVTEPGEMTLSDEFKDIVWEFKVEEETNKSNIEILLDNADAKRTAFKIPGVEGTITLEEMFKTDSVAVSGLYITSAHSGTVTISYLGSYTCRVPYRVTDGSAS